MLYECLTGCLPFGEAGVGAAMAPVVALHQSMAQYRNVGVGEEDFDGYN